MKQSLLIIFFTVISFAYGRAQVPQPEPASTTTTEQQLENITENSEDQETEDDSYLQQLNQLQRNPVNINKADETFFKELRILTALQIHSFLTYRSLLGKLISLYELQAVPGWDLLTIQKIKPFISVSDNQGLFDDIGKRLQNGDHTLLFRVSQTLEKSKGYL